MTRGPVEVQPPDVRGHDGLVATPHLLLLEEVREGLAKDGALRQPHREAGADLLREHEQAEFAAKLAVVALPGQLQPLQMLLQQLLLGESDAVEAGELRAGFVAAPVGARDVEQLDRLDRLSARDVRPPAEVHEAALLVEGDGAVFEAFEQFELVFVALLLEVRDGLGLGHGAAFVARVVARQFDHLLLDGREVVGGELAVAEVHVVVEPVLDGGADAELDAGVERFERLSHEVRRGMPEGHLSALALPRQDLDRRVAFDGAMEVAHFAVDTHGERVAGEAGGDRLGDLKAGGALRVIADGAVGESDVHKTRGVGGIEGIQPH